jgi:hypothetical protein
LLVAGVLLISCWSDPALGSDGEVHGYCQDGKPVIEELPEKYTDYRAECDGPMLVVVPTFDRPGAPAVILVPPPDFYAWVEITLNGRVLINPYRDAYPFVIKSTGRTVIPIRMVTEGMGGTAEWNEAAREVTIRLGDKYMVMTIGLPTAIANGRSITLDQPPLIWMDRTMVPLRVLVEAFGAKVNWRNEEKWVEILLPGVQCRQGYCSEF